jgi:hypothetical protein
LDLVVKGLFNSQEKIVIRFASLGLAFLILLSAHLAHSSSQVLNGGDAVDCSVGNGFPPERPPGDAGYYSLDYVLTYDPGASPIYPAKSLNESLSRLSALMKQKLPELSPSFDIFMRDFMNRDMSKTYLWQPAQSSLIDVPDEKLISQLPQNCRSGVAQAVVRQSAGYTRMPSHIVFAYDKYVVGKLSQIPVQLSFLLVHEWLWDFSHEVVTNRMLNRLFHSKDFETMSRDQLLNYFRQVSFTLPNDAISIIYPESCEASPNISPAMFNSLRVTGAASGGSLLTCREDDCQYSADGSQSIFNRVWGSWNPQFIFSEGNRLEFKITSGQYSKDALDCRAELMTGQVSCGTLDQFSTVGQRKLVGTMNPSCIRLVDDDIQTNNNGGIYRQLNVLYLKLNNQERARFR